MGSLLTGLVGGFIGSKHTALITTYNVIISTILSLIVFYQVAICGSNYMIDWRPVIDNSLVASLNDVITLMLLIILVFSSLTHICLLLSISDDPHIFRNMFYFCVWIFLNTIMFTQINIVISLVAFVVPVYFHFQSIKVFIMHFGLINYRLCHICVVGIPTLHHTSVPIIVTVATYYNTLEIYQKI